jgi:ribosomal-protein-alanine N-acetyltransferase
MTYADLGDVLAIEKSVYGFPWPETIFRDCIRVGYRCRVLEGRVWLHAYGLMSIGAGEAHLLNLCVRPESQGRGFAQRLLDHLLTEARTDEVRSVFLEVRPSNARAIRLYQRMGFVEVGVRPDYYPGQGRREDALVMAKEL